MSTHHSPCLICGEETYCCNDEHVLGIEIDGHSGQCANSRVTIGEFCSLKCFYELRTRWEKRLEWAKELYPHWFKEAP